MRKPRWRTLLVWLASAVALLSHSPVLAAALVVGVNVVNPMRASVADQNAVLAELKAAHVTVIRCGIPNDDKGLQLGGQWLNHVELQGKTLIGWVHNETACDYATGGQTHASMTIATSADYGLTWYSAYKLVGELGYVLTAPDPAHASVEPEECVSDEPGHADHILIEKGACESHGYRRLRSAGFGYSAEQPNTEPLYRCYSDAEKSHFARQPRRLRSYGQARRAAGV
jgi:hypothetical protein